MIERNLIYEYRDNTIQFIGDPHLGRIFKTGVPSSKLGVREEMVYEQFEELLNTESNCVVVVGDLFDKSLVHPSVLYRTFNILEKCSKEQPNKQFYILPGNHDLSKDKTKISTYILLSIMCNHLPNVCVILDEPKLVRVGEIDLILDSYNPFWDVLEEDPYQSTRPLLEELREGCRHLWIGHWDDIRFDKGYTPDFKIAKSFDYIISGHIHTPFETSINGVEMYYIGSMQPYAFNEDLDGVLYVRHTPESIEVLSEAVDGFGREVEPYSALKNKNIKVDCEPSYIIPAEVDCLSVVYNYIHPKDKTVAVKRISLLPSFDFPTLLRNNLTEEGISEESIDKVINYLKNGEKFDL